MARVHTYLSTGLPGLDAVLEGVRPGDNIVWQVDSIDDYLPFVTHFCIEANNGNKKLIYFRFADHPYLLPPEIKANVYNLHPENGIEVFIDEIFDVIEKMGTGACYVFDCLSELAVDWYSDRMLGNFFMVTCPYLYDYETATYFALLKNHHTPHAITAIHTTAQVVIDVYRNKGKLHIQPQKVYKRHSDTMYTLHAWEKEGQFVPVRHSATISEILGSVAHPWLDFSVHYFDVWTRSFSSAQEIADEQSADGENAPETKKVFSRLLRMAVTRDPKLISLAETYFGLTDLIEIGKRMIGTGLIGGKSAGMLLARAILRKNDGARWNERMGAHDSFYIGSDVFYTYLIRNGCWWVRRKLKDPEKMFDSSQEARSRMLSGTFPDDILAQFTSMLSYFGQSPIIVRSSSLLEDAYGNAFSGKYESVFCANQGTPAERLESFVAAVRTVYASTMSHGALSYRAHWGLLDKDEQMALLVQRVSGSASSGLFMPHVAGVGFSFNPFVWSPDIDPRSGVLRLVFGLGTRAVDRSDNDYTRIVSLGSPDRRPDGSGDDPGRCTQRKADVLDLGANELRSIDFSEICLKEGCRVPLSVVASRDTGAEERALAMGVVLDFPWILSFESLLGETSFVNDMKALLSTLETAYRHPVDIEFTANFLDDGTFRIDLVQCRPFQVRKSKAVATIRGGIPAGAVVLRTDGPVIGSGFSAPLDRVIYIVPPAYSSLSEQQQYSVARLIGRLTHVKGPMRAATIMLIGPGRWGTTTPSLGVPVSFAEIDTVSVLCELALMHEGLVPDISLGTHFFNDLVEMDLLYMGVYPERKGSFLNKEFFETGDNLLPLVLPDAAFWAPTVRVIDGASAGLFLHANPIEQQGVVFSQQPVHDISPEGTLPL
jgi:hypothetical protein